MDGQKPDHWYTISSVMSLRSGKLNQRTNGLINAHIISGLSISTQPTKSG